MNAHDADMLDDLCEAQSADRRSGRFALEQTTHVRIHIDVRGATATKAPSAA